MVEERFGSDEVPMKVGFLFNHYAEHQVPHAAPYAFELSLRQPGIEVVILCSSSSEMRMVRRIASLYRGHRCTIRRLHLGWRDRLKSSFKDPWRFKRKKKILAANLDVFRSLDALVTPEQTSLRLKRKFGMDKLLLVHTRHGAGDAEAGFDDRSQRFDFTLLPGQKYADRLKAMGFLEDGSYAITGWPKFDVAEGLQRSKKRLFANDRPIVAYNPHFKNELSSWPMSGEAILETFAASPDYNLIFAPHILLFKRKANQDQLEKERTMLRRYQKFSNILIDTGSAASSDMTYMLAADIYLGDVSSQVYEFLLRPRPCIFVNDQKVAWEGDESFIQWRFGEVIQDVESELLPALGQARTRHADFADEQTAAFNYTFRIEADSTAAARGADAIADFLRSAGDNVADQDHRLTAA